MKKKAMEVFISLVDIRASKKNKLLNMFNRFKTMHKREAFIKFRR